MEGSHSYYISIPSGIMGTQAHFLSFNISFQTSNDIKNILSNDTADVYFRDISGLLHHSHSQYKRTIIVFQCTKKASIALMEFLFP